MNKDTSFEPDPEFVSRLEWQLKSELRRQVRASETKPARTNGWFRRLLLMALSALAGFALATASSRFQNFEERQLTLARAEAAVELLQARLGLVQAYVEETEAKALTEPDQEYNVKYARHEAGLVERDLSRALLDLEETHLTGKPPNNELTAPEVRGRDFVSERLSLELEDRAERADLMRQDLSEAASRLEDENDPHLLALERELSLAEHSELEMHSLLQLRKSFLEGERTAEEVLRLTDLARAEEQLEAALTRLRHTQALGPVLEGDSSLDDLQWEFERTAAEIEARLAKMELDYLKSQLESR